MSDEIESDGGYTDDPVQAGPKKQFSFLIIFWVVLAFVGGTSALRISLGEESIEFGQYVRVVTACDDYIQIQGVAGTGAEIEKVKAINVNGLDTQACDGKIITIKAYTTSDASALDLYSYTSSGTLYSVDNLSLTVVSEALTLNNVSTSDDSSLSHNINYDSDTGVYSVTFTNPIATVGSVNTWTLQTSSS